MTTRILTLLAALAAASLAGCTTTGQLADGEHIPDEELFELRVHNLDMKPVNILVAHDQSAPMIPLGRAMAKVHTTFRIAWPFPYITIWAVPASHLSFTTLDGTRYRYWSALPVRNPQRYRITVPPFR